MATEYEKYYSKDKPQKMNPDDVEPNMRVGQRRRNENIDKGKRLCENCGGTGNSGFLTFAIYTPCPECNETGVAK